MCAKSAEVARNVQAVAGSPNVVESDYVDWTKINSLCPIGTTTVPVVYSVAAKSGDAVSAAARFPTVVLQLDTAVYGVKAPSSVAGAMATVTMSGGVHLGWSRGTAVSEYRIERALGTKSTFQPLVTLPGNATSYADATAGLKSLAVSYRITAVNPNGSSTPVVVTPH